MSDRANEGLGVLLKERDTPPVDDCDIVLQKDIEMVIDEEWQGLVEIDADSVNVTDGEIEAVAAEVTLDEALCKQDSLKVKDGDAVTLEELTKELDEKCENVRKVECVGEKEPEGHAEGADDPLENGEGEAEKVLGGVAVTQPLADTVEEPVAVDDDVLEEEGEPERLAVPMALAELDAVFVELSVPDTETVPHGDAVEHPLAVEEVHPLAVDDDVPDDEGEPVRLEVALPLPVPDAVPVGLSVPDTETVPHGVAVEHSLAVEEVHPLAVDDDVPDDEGEPVRLEVALPLPVLDAVPVGLSVPDTETVPHGVVEPDNVNPLCVGDALALPLAVNCEAVEEGDAEAHRDGSALREAVGLQMPLKETLTLGEDANDAETHTVAEPLSVGGALALPLAVNCEAVEEGDAETHREGPALNEALELQLSLKETLTLEVTLLEDESLGDTDGEAVSQPEALPLRAPVTEAAPLREEDAVTVRARRSEGDGVPEEERLDEEHAEVVEDAEVQCDGVGEEEAEVQADALGLALSLALPVELPDTAGEALSSRDGKALPVVLDVPLPLVARELEVVGDTLREREPVAVLQPVAETLLLRVGEEVPEGDVQPDAEGEKDADTVADSQRDTLPLPVLEALKEGLELVHALGLPLADTLALCGALALDEKDAAERVPEKDGVPQPDGEVDTVLQEVEVREGEGVCETLIVPLRLTVGLRVTEGHTLREGVSVASDVALALGEPDTEEQLDGEFEAEAL